MNKIKTLITAIVLIVCLFSSNICVMASLGENELPPLFIYTEDTKDDVAEDNQTDNSANDSANNSANAGNGTSSVNSGNSGGGSGGGSYIPSTKPTQQPTAPKPEVQEPTEPENNKTFSDVKKDDWFYNDVAYVFDNGLMTGTSESEFSPEVTLNRAMMITILHRIDKDDSVYEKDVFSDVEKNSWYENAVKWGFENKIVSGTSENTFAPMDNLTREQLCVMLYNYTAYIGVKTEFADISSYSDDDTVSDWAKDAVCWAVQEKIVTGKGTIPLLRRTALQEQRLPLL